ncbi:MAG: cyclodeaminase/cyclohydrolase family protein [Oscillospiraceae bacterium]|nr:cyclodeaminase/cyclohydrolase family protein [Oscillospiraceae bacterium]
MLELSLTDFTEKLSSKDAVPGGGGASALVGALGAALASMVGNLTVGKPKYAAVEEDVKALMLRAKNAEKKLLALVEEDAKAFEPLSRAYGIPKTDPSRDEVMEKALEVASAPPMEMMRVCAEVINILAELIDKGSVLAVSDVGVGAALASAAMKGASLNVFINTGLMKNRETTEKLNAEADELLNKYVSLADGLVTETAGRVRK